jgi:hypothetical protein
MKPTLKSTIFLPIVALLTLGVADVYAQESVKMTFSGLSENSANNLLQPNTISPNDEDDFAGTGTLGSFTLRNVRAMTPSSSNSCDLYFTEPAGGGIFRFQDGSLLYLQLTSGSDCIDFATGLAHCTVNFIITGGTGRFSNVSNVAEVSTLTLTETVATVLADSSGNPVYSAATGQITGKVYGVSVGQGQGGGQ